MRYYLRQLILFMMRWLHIIRLCQFIRRKRIVILTIHGVMDDRDDPSWKPLRPRLSRNKLDDYLRVLSRRYRFVSLMDAVDMLQGRRPILPYSIVLTFDDGYRNNLTHAWPILRQYKAPATFFVPTGFLDNPRPFWWDRLDYALQQAQTNGRDMTIGSVTVRLDYSSRDTLRESYKRLRRAAKEQRMSDLEFLRQVESIYTQLEKESGKKLSDIQKNDGWSAILSWKHVETFGDEDVAFGSHTVDHIRLGLVDLDVVYDQLEKSKRDIETHTGKPCLSLCYPSGSFTERTVDLAEKCGYLCGVTTMEGLNHIGDNVMTLRRIDLPVNVACRDLLFRLSVTGS